jgi:hypothetical protein
MKKKVILIIVLSLIFFGLVYSIYSLNKNVNEKKQIIANMQLASKNANLKYKHLMNSKDSLMLVNAFLARYRSLTVAMSYRDSVRLTMKYCIGDVVRLKRDSSRAIVNDIIVGGGKHEYYIKYEVIFKNGNKEELVPELLY